MPGAPFRESAAGIDLSQRIAGSTAVVASPTDNTETVIGSVTVPGGLSYATGVFVVAWAAFTVGTNGVSVNLKVRQTSVSGSTIAATGVTNEGVTAATQLGTRVVWGLDTAPGDSQIYKATLTVGSGSAASTVSALFLGVFAVQRVSEQLYEFTHDYPFHTPLPDLQPQNATSVAYAASLVAVTGRARCFGFQGYNSGAAQFVLVFDRDGLPADGAAPVIVIPAAATSIFDAYFGSAGRWFDRGIVLCNSSTGPTKTIGGADCWFDVQFVAGDQGQPVGIVSGGGGGYTPPTGRQLLTGNNVNIANGGVGLMTWNTSFGPNVLLDRSTLTSPAVLTAGVYAVSISVLSGAMTVGGTFQGVLELDWDNADAGITMDSAPASAALTTPQLSLTSVFYIPAGSTIRATVRNHDGVNAVDFGFTAQVQKIT